MQFHTIYAIKICFSEPICFRLSGRRSRCIQRLIQHFYKILNAIGDICERASGECVCVWGGGGGEENY